MVKKSKYTKKVNYTIQNDHGLDRANVKKHVKSVNEIPMNMSEHNSKFIDWCLNTNRHT